MSQPDLGLGEVPPCSPQPFKIPPPQMRSRRPLTLGKFSLLSRARVGSGGLREPLTPPWVLGGLWGGVGTLGVPAEGAGGGGWQGGAAPSPPCACGLCKVCYVLGGLGGLLPAPAPSLFFLEELLGRGIREFFPLPIEHGGAQALELPPIGTLRPG